MASVHLDSVWLQPLRKGHRQHAIGLLRLAIGYAIVVAAAFELQIAQVKIACPVTGDVDDAGRCLGFQLIAEQLGQPEVAQYIRGKLHFDPLGSLLSLTR
jgi:hypothetical protein